MSTAQAFTIKDGGYCNGLTFEKNGKRVTFDPPVSLEVGFTYAVDLNTGDIWQVFDGGGYMECIARGK